LGVSFRNGPESEEGEGGVSFRREPASGRQALELDWKVIE